MWNQSQKRVSVTPGLQRYSGFRTTAGNINYPKARFLFRKALGAHGLQPGILTHRADVCSLI